MDDQKINELSREERLRLADVEIAEAYRKAETLHCQLDGHFNGLSEASNEKYFLEFIEERKKALKKYNLTFEEYRRLLECNRSKDALENGWYYERKPYQAK